MSKLPLVFFITACVAFTSCDDNSHHESGRSYKMGFQNSAPRFDDINLYMQSLKLWTTRADAAIIVTEVPWQVYFSGADFIDYVVDNYKDLAAFYASKDLELYVCVDPQNGLDRASDAIALVQEGRSISEPEIQEVYRRFVVVMDSVLTPAHLGLALETNLIRAIASPAIYNGVKTAASNAALDLEARNSTAILSISVQAEMAWGKLGGGTYTGVEQDFTDFPFIAELGISSYPYFGYETPEEMPANYYSRLLNGRNIPVFVSEGGWASGSVPDSQFTRNEDIQERYIEHHHHLLTDAHATAYFQLLFTDIDESALPPDVPPNIVYFTSIGLVRRDFSPKPALTAWDELFALHLQQ
ncbi:MAG TPA: hypothetical protein VEB86_08560 [Chryseosolibacter sp.]|nr:hypothetical protein [Chryseosolibacter sp.]